MLDALQPVARRLARLGEGVDGGEIRMRRKFPGAGNEAARLPALALRRKQASGDLGGGDKRRRKPQRFARKRERFVGLGCFKIARLGRQQHGATPERDIGLDIAVPARHGERGECAFPIARAGLHVEQRVDAPASLRIGAHGLLGKCAGRVMVVAALRLKEQAAQSPRARSPADRAWPRRRGAPTRGRP